MFIRQNQSIKSTDIHHITAVRDVTLLLSVYTENRTLMFCYVMHFVLRV